MTTDEEKSRIAKLLQGLDVPETKLTERCTPLVKDFHHKFDKEVEEEAQSNMIEEVYENPYRVDVALIEENERKLRELLFECRRAKKECNDDLAQKIIDPKRPWRTNSNKEKLVRIDCELKQHHDKATDLLTPMDTEDMQELVKTCRAETLLAPPILGDRLRETVNAAKKNLTNFQYRKVENTSATAILPEAHELEPCSGQYIPRPKSKYCFLRSLGELQNLRVLGLEYSHIADGSGCALLSLLPVIKRPHFRLQLICREEQMPGRADAALGVGGYEIPDTAWRRVNIACPDLYVHMAFFRIRDYDNVRRFLVPSIPLREIHLQLGIDLKIKQRQDSDWRFATFPLRRVFELIPRLGRFHYIGKVEDDVDLKRMFLILSCGVCEKLKQLTIQIQDEGSKRDYWRQVVDSLTSEFADIMQLYHIKICITVYKI
ncbi:Uncharacterized protein OBRU01_01738 [Operophtera brumata]|uniref:Uncharacterized protein n=1 Tax=Operophtera brumata TaxID=104452 RepID=A0A0L7LM55_OPEBR|nr:Uncharacterized protein OBRU01_01738 [Operophtera brumata]